MEPAAVLPLTDALEAELPRMLAEHGRIVAARDAKNVNLVLPCVPADAEAGAE